MEKFHTEYHPRIKEAKVDFTRAVVSMLNVRRYLQNEGYSELRDINSLARRYVPPHLVKKCVLADIINTIASGYGAIYFPEGFRVDDYDFKNTTDRDSLLEMIIEKHAKFQKTKKYPDFAKSKVIRCTYQIKGYKVKLSVVDTKKSKRSLFSKMFKSSDKDRELFTFKYTLRLNKDIITDEDLKQFEIYIQDINQAAQEEKPLIYTSQHSPVTKSSSQPQVKHFKPDLINPWYFDLPKLGDEK